MGRTNATYHAIALDIATRILEGDIPLNNRLSGRSLLAGHYQVSPETIRKAVLLLKNANVVTVSQGKEIRIVSAENARLFLAHHQAAQSVYSLRQELEALLSEKRQLDDRLEKVFTDLIFRSDRLRNLTPFNPFEIVLASTAHALGRTVADLRIWQATGATLIAIRRETELFVSPGPSIQLQAADRLVFVGQGDIPERVANYLNQPCELPQTVRI